MGNSLKNESILGSAISGIQAYLDNFTWLDYGLAFLDIAIVAVIIYYVFVFIKGTRATRIIYGAIVLIIILLLGRLLNLQTLNWAQGHITTFVIVAIPIVFQPELRRALEKLGRTKILKRSFNIKSFGRLVNETIKTVKILQKNKVGALIIIMGDTGLEEYIETGTRINGRLTSELLLNIFYPNSPLHDGAVIIQNNELLAAGCMLPISEGEYSYTHGTRHRAGIGITEETDAISIVVSEERGIISVAKNGKLKENLSIDELEEFLQKSLRN